ncbi:MAG TPA: YbaK/EbsC family protein [Bryobacteraceae bacterium]|nr:YbaK/EbsC family protein [Bryobacteraceae bacterium]
MLWSQLSIQTLREETHPPLVRAGYKRGNEYLFLGRRVLEKIRALGDVKAALAECGVPYVRAGADLVVEDPNGDDVVVRGHEYAELLGRAISIAQAPEVPDPGGDPAPEEFHTPGVKTIAQIATFSHLPPTSQIKSVVMVAGSAPILVLLRGDHQLSEFKFATVAGSSSIRPATAEELRASFGADAGSLGPILPKKAGAANVRILADEALRGRRNMISGANRNDYHLRNVTPGKDFQAEFFDLRQAAEGDHCVTDGGPLTFAPALVIRDAKSALAVAVEKNHDADGIVLPPSIAPFTAVVTPVHPDRLEAARKIYEDLLRAGVDALLDDRDARPGVKFKDADLIGIPYRINVGKKLAEGLVEFVERSPRRSTDVPVREIRIPG